MLRAHLIMNPEARRVTPAMQRVVQAALEARLKLDVTHTHARGAAIEVARSAAQSGTELIVAFGGEGLLNEVANGIVGSTTALAVIPGGTMNVLARNLGIPADPLEATDRILQRAGEVETIAIPLGLAGDRYFISVCGCGFDAEAAARVDAHRRSKRRFGETYYYAAAFTTFALAYLGRKPFLRCEGPFGTQEGVMAIGLNAGTYSYLFGRPVRLGLSRTDDPVLDLFMLRRLDLRSLPSYALGAIVSGRFGAQALQFHGLERFTVTGSEPFAVHVDGEPLPGVDVIEVRAGAATLRVLV